MLVMSVSAYSKTLPSLSINFVDSRTHLRFLQTTSLIIIRSFSHSERSISERTPQQQNSFAVSYLVNSCRLTPEYAISASKRVHFETPERPDAFLFLLKNHGFTISHISKIVKSRPKLLQADSEKIVLPKLEFFRSIGLVGPNLVRFISSNPSILCSSLENRLIPTFNFLKDALLLDDLVIKALRHPSRIFALDVQTTLVPNVLALREAGVPHSSIQRMLVDFPRLLCFKAEKFNGIAKKVIDMGFSPTQVKFFQAFKAAGGLSESTWQRKVEAFARWGWSEDEILLAFKRQPLCMTFSVEKIMGAMDFLVNVMGLKSSGIVENPMTLFYSLKKRIIPRGLVIKVLLWKGLILEDVHFSSALHLCDKHFLDRFVVKHQVHVPQLLDIFLGKMSLQELGFQSEDTLGAQVK